MGTRVLGRVGILVLAAGLALISSSVALPEMSEGVNLQMGQEAAFPFFLLPTSTTIAIGRFSGNATLYVLPLGSDLNLGKPLVNLTVHGLESVTFPVPSRGYYTIELNSTAGSDALVGIGVTQHGIPFDTVLGGTVLSFVGAGTYLLSRYKARLTK